MTLHLDLSAPEYATFDYIRRYQRQHGYAPTLAEIARALTVTDVTIWRRLKSMQAKGWITRKRYQTRSIQIVKRDTKRADVTIVKVYRNENTVTETVNDFSRSWAVHKYTVDLLIYDYKARGFKACPLPGNVVLLTKRTAAAKAVALPQLKAVA